MAKRNRYRELEGLMTKLLAGDALVFVLYLFCAGHGWAVLKVISASIAIVGSLLCLGWLFITGEFPRRRSLWMVTAFAAIVLCMLVSLLLGYPCPVAVDPGAVATMPTVPTI